MRKKLIRSIKILTVLIIFLLAIQICSVTHKNKTIEISGQYGNLSFSTTNYEVVNLDENNIYDFQIKNGENIIISGMITDIGTCDATYKELAEDISKENISYINNNDSEYNIIVDNNNMSTIMIFGKSKNNNGFIAYGLSTKEQIEAMLKGLVIK